MRRYQYRLNDQNVSLTPSWGKLQPLKYIETIPGETYGGMISVKANSGLMGQVIHSRAYYDLYAFYCPIRLLWPEFPQFLASSEGEMNPPTVATLFPENFENGFAGSTEDSKNAAFLRRMYWMVFAQFFERSHGGNKKLAAQEADSIRAGEWDTKTPVLQQVSARASTFDQSWLNKSEVVDQSVQGVVNGSRAETPLDNIRRAYALDRWEKMRDYYGGHYTDLLKGYGVKADWGILQEPECMGISNNDFRFVQRNSTGDTNFGDRNGYFEGEYKLKLRKTFTPEHGVIGVYGVARADVFNQAQGPHILTTRDDPSPSNWYDPITWKAYNQQRVPGNIINAGRTDDVVTPIGEHLRKGRNEIAVPADTDWSTLPVFSREITENTARVFSHHSCTPEPIPSGSSRVNVGAAQICHYTETRITKRSPLVPGAVAMQR